MSAQPITVDFSGNMTWEFIVFLVAHKQNDYNIILDNVDSKFHRVISGGFARIMAQTTYWGNQNDKLALVFGIANWDSRTTFNKLLFIELYPEEKGSPYVMKPESVDALIKAFGKHWDDAEKIRNYNSRKNPIGLLQWIMDHEPISILDVGPQILG